MKNKGLGAALVGGAALDATSMLMSQPEPWMGYPKDGGGPQFSGDAAGLKFGDCLDSEGGDVAKALMAPKDAPREPPSPQGVLRLTDSERNAAAKAYDSKAMYEAPSCPTN